MTPFKKIKSKTIPLPIKDIDTDMIIPAQYLMQTGSSGFGNYLFERLCKNIPNFPLNNSKYKGNTILVARDNFGCGSSREHAVWALLQYGFRAIIAPSFSDIFANNSLKNGLVLVLLSQEIVEDLLCYEGEVSVDLVAQTVSFDDKVYEFKFDQFRKDCIINGYEEDIDYIQQQIKAIDKWHEGRENKLTYRSEVFNNEQSKPKNIIQKIWGSHLVYQKQGHPAIFGVDLQLVHEVTSPQAFSMLRNKNLSVKYPQKHIATLDHSIPTRQDRENIHDPVAKKQVDTLRQNVVDFGIKINDFGSGSQGIVHVMAPELGLINPGMTIVCGDSHASTHGAFGAMAFGVGTSEVGLVMATGCILQQKPKTMKVEFIGKLPDKCYSKDVILKLISKIGISGANGHIIEFCGEAIENLTMEGRMSLCNMSIEAGARAGLISPDQTTFDYLQTKLGLSELEFENKKQYWQSYISDAGCTYDKSITIDITNLEPQISWGTNPSQTIGITESIPTIKTISKESKNNHQNALNYTKLEDGQKLLGQDIDWVFIGSCTNSRLEDLKIVANILCPSGNLNDIRSINSKVKCYIVPGSEQVKSEAEKLGLDKIFKKAGANWRMPGCSMCLGMNDDKVPAGSRCVSTSNRNFMHRQGKNSITHLASPATAIWSAIRGCVSDIRDM